MNKLKMLLCCNFCDPERGEVYEVSRVCASTQSPPRPSPPNASKGQVLSVCQPSALCEGKVDSVLDPSAFSPPFCSTKVDDQHGQDSTVRLSYPDSSDFDLQDVPSYPGPNVTSVTQENETCIVPVEPKADNTVLIPSVDSLTQIDNTLAAGSEFVTCCEKSHKKSSGIVKEEREEEVSKQSRTRLYSEVTAKGSSDSSGHDSNETAY